MAQIITQRSSQPWEPAGIISGVNALNNPPVMVGFAAELMAMTRIENAAEKLGWKVFWIERLAQIAAPEPILPQRQLAEHLHGPGAVLIERLTEWQPALMIFDLGNSEIPWREWIALIKSAPATRRLPLICYGSHVAADVLTDAREAGADAVLARSKFFANIPGHLERYGRKIDPQALATDCRQSLSLRALEGLELFNRGHYFEAHEALEDAWNQDPTPGKELYRAILQVAVAYLQIERGNYNGARKMFLRLRQWIDPLPDLCRGVDVKQLREDAGEVRRRLLELGEHHLDEFDHTLFRPVVYQTGL